MESFLEKYKWFLEDLNKAEKDVKRKVFNGLRLIKKKYFPKEVLKADVGNLINCAFLPILRLYFNNEFTKPFLEKLILILTKFFLGESYSIYIGLKPISSMNLIIMREFFLQHPIPHSI